MDKLTKQTFFWEETEVALELINQTLSSCLRKDQYDVISMKKWYQCNYTNHTKKSRKI